MSKQFLFGPVTCEFGRHLQKQRASGICRVFAPEPGTDVQAAHHEAWEDIVNKFTDGWRPEMLVLHLEQNAIPPALWQAPVPIVAVAEHLHLQWHSRRQMLSFCDLVLTDALGVETLQKVGMAHIWQSALADAQLWQEQLERIEADWPAMLERAARRRERAGRPDLLSAAWEGAGTPSGPDPALARRLAAAEVERPRDAALGNARGVVALSTGARPGALVTAAHAFQDAWSADPRHAVAGLNLAETLAALHQRGNAADQAQGVLEVLDEIEVLPAVALDDLLFPNGAGLLHAEWERAAWENAGDCAAEARAKTDLVRLRLQTKVPSWVVWQPISRSATRFRVWQPNSADMRDKGAIPGCLATNSAFGNPTPRLATDSAFGN